MKMIIDRAIVEQALEACEQRLPLKGQAAIIDELNNLRAALARQDEPVANEIHGCHGGEAATLQTHPV